MLKQGGIPPSNMTRVTVADHELEFPSDDLVPLRDSTDLIEDETTLRERFQRDGYLFIREFHDPDLVNAARNEVLEHMSTENLLHPDKSIAEGIIHPDWFGEKFDMSAASWTHYPNLDVLISGDSIMSFFERFLGEKPLAFDRKLGRAKATSDFTGFHVDNIFMGRGTDELYTVWRPIGDCPVEMGPLLVCPESHKHQRLRETYAQMDVDREAFESFFSKDPYDVIETIGGPLATANFEAGDALIFGPYLLHGSLNNQTDRFRISVDTRYQSVEQPVDGRWVGADPIGHYQFGQWEDPMPMEKLRKKWCL